VKRALTTYAVMLQVVAILLLQWYPLAPHLSRQHGHLQCRGDHRLCGCSPERVAAHTCCCNQRKPACCDKKGPHEEDQLAGRDGKTASPYFSTAPCGGSPKFVTASLDKLKFVRADVLSAITAHYSPQFPSPLGETAASRITEPPEPPPKLIAFT
jgi:hypothetical protein